MEAHSSSKMIFKARSLKSPVKRQLFLDEYITSSNDVFQDFQSDMVERIGQLGNSTRKTAESNDTAK